MDALIQQDAWLASDEPIGSSNARIFDFTLVFENSILSILPAAILLLIAPLHVWLNTRGAKVASAGSLYWAKLVTAIAMVAMEVARSVVWCRGRFPDSSLPTLSSTSLASAVLGPAGALAFLVMMHVEHFYTNYSSSVIGMGLFTTLLFDAARARSFWIRSSFAPTGQLSVVILCLEIVFLVLQEIPKTLNDVSAKDWFGEAKAGFFSRIFIGWLNKIMVLGYRSEITMGSLGTLGPQFSAEALAARLERNWDSTAQDGNPKSKHALARAILKTFKWPLLAVVIPQWLHSITSFTLPLLIQQVLIFMTSTDKQPPVAAALLGASIISYIVNGIAATAGIYYMNRWTTYVRASLIVLLVKKDLRIGLSDATKAASVGLMTADIETIVQSFTYVSEVFTMLPEISMALYLLWRIIGEAFFLTLLQLAAFWVASYYIGKKNGPAFSKWNQAIQGRVSEATAAIAQMKGIRMIGLDQVIGSYLQSLRAHEIHQSWTARFLRLVSVTAYFLQTWTSFVVFLVGGLYWTIWRDGLDPVTLWPVVAYNRILGASFYTIVDIYPSIMSVLACVSRIQNFLTSPEQEDHREILATGSGTATLEKEKEPANGPAIVFSGVCVKAKDDEHLVLDGASFEIPTSTLALVVGVVGSGKSVLLKTIMGETHLNGGKIQLATARVGLCDQIPWLPYLSVRDAVVGETPWDEGRYRDVIDACALAHDISRFPSGDATMVGANGSGLSGGQKQRVALARAVYSFAPILVCDDILSALDGETATAVFRDVFSHAGILKRQGRTAVVATHAVQWLTSADQVLVTKNGKVIIRTDKTELIEYAATAVLSGHHHSVVGEEVESEVLDEVQTELDFARASQGTRATDLGLYAFMLQAVPRLIIIGFCVACAAIALVESFPEIYLRLWMQQDASNKLYIIGVCVLTVVAVGIVGCGLGLYQMVMMPTISMSLHSIFVGKVMSATLSFLTSTDGGLLLNRFSQDMTLIGQELPLAMYGAACAGGNTIIAIVVVASSTPYASICIPVSLLVMWLVQYYYLRTSRQIRLLDLESKTPLYAKMTETQRGVETIRGLGWQEQTITKSINLIDDSQVPFYYMFIIQRWLFVVLILLGCGVATVLSGMALYLSSTASQAGVGLGLTNTLHFSLATIKFIQRFTKLETSLGAIARLRTFVEDTPSESDEGRKPAPDNWPSRGAIEFVNVCARYGSEADAPLVLRNVSLQFDAGEKVVIVGRTGSGKSTIILTLLNFLDMTGSITIDGVDISTVPRHQLRSQITTLPQDSIEILGSIYNNLLPFDMERKLKGLETSKSANVVSDEKATMTDSDKIDGPGKDRTAELEAVLERVHLLDIIKGKGGLEASIKDLRLSSGQRQLFNIARTILHKRDTGSKIVLMDEVTSHMDIETDKTIQTLLDSEFGDCTRIIISHRTTGFVNCDKLVTMQDGKVVGVKDMKMAKSADITSLEAGKDCI